MILVDSSAWIEYLRRTESAADHAVDELLRHNTSAATTEVVVMEVLAGSRDELHERRLRQLLGRCHLVPLDGLPDFEAAAALYASCRHAGVTIRALDDCLVAAVARREDLEVLHADRDFNALASHVGLRIADGSLR